MAASPTARCNRALLIALISTFTFVLAACSNSPKDAPLHQTVLNPIVAPGAIFIDVLEPGQPERYWQYQVLPAIGLVRKVKEESVSSSAQERIPRVFQQPAGAIETCARKPEASSPDRKYLAFCASSESDEFFVMDRNTTKPLLHWKLSEWRRIRGFAWAPNSRSVAFLNVSSHTGKGPGDLFSSLSGHPVSYDTVFLNILDVRTGKMTAYEVTRDVRSSFTRILNWSQ